MNNLVIGIDPSSKHIALVARQPVTKTLAVAKYDLREKKNSPYKPEVAAEAKYAIEAFLDSVSRMAAPRAGKLVFLEDPLVGRGGVRATMVQSFVSGVIQAVFVQAGFDVKLVNVKTWKRVVCGNGNATKEQVARVIGTKWPKAHRSAAGDQDIIDAAAICLYGCAVAGDRDLQP